MTQGRPQPGHVVVAPNKRDIGLLHQIIHYSITAWSTVPTITGDDQLVNGKVSNDSAGKVNEVKDAAAARQFLDDSFNIFTIAVGGRFVKDFCQQFAVRRREEAHAVLEGAPYPQHSHDLE